MTIAPGTKLGRYEIRSKLGQGGMGEVYLAQDASLERKVALKILPTEVSADPKRMRRFEQEAKATSSLNHPNIITIHEIGELGSTKFIATEFIDGETLRHRLTSGRVTLSESLEIAIQVANALVAAHELGIVHRDIKPENIMLRRDRLVKVLDFGLAKINDPHAEVDTEAQTRTLLQTGAGVVMGTAFYMSPEQARALPLDHRTDIWSLGVVLYELIAGCLPFQGTTASEAAASVLNEKDAPPLARFSRDTPAELERIVGKALRKDREQRYQGIKDLLLDLQSLKQELEFEARREWSQSGERGTAYAVGFDRQESQTETGLRAKTTAPDLPQEMANAGQFVEKIKRHKIALMLAVASLLLVVAGLSYSRRWYLAGPNTTISSLAVLPLVNASNDPDTEYLSDGITESIINSLAQLPQIRVIARTTVFAYKGQTMDPRKVGRDLGVDAVLTGKVIQRGENLIIQADLVDVSNGSQLWGEQYNRRLADIFTVQEEISREISSRLKLRLSGEDQKRLTRRYTENTEAYKLYLKGNYYWSKPGEIRKSREYFQQAVDLDPSYALGYVGLSQFYGFMSAQGLMPPKEGWPKSEAAAIKAQEIDDTLAEVHLALAAIRMFYYRDWLGAQRELKRGIELNPNYPEIHNLYGSYLVQMGQLSEAIRETRRALELDPLASRYSRNLARRLYIARQYDQAIEQYGKALELDANDVKAHQWLAAAYEQKGMKKEAVAGWRAAMRVAHDEELANILDEAYAASGFDGAIRAVWQKKLERLKQKDSREYVLPMEYVEAYFRLGQTEQAIMWLERACEERTTDVLLVKIDPFFDSLRSHPRFAEIVRCLGA